MSNERERGLQAVSKDDIRNIRDFLSDINTVEQLSSFIALLSSDLKPISFTTVTETDEDDMQTIGDSLPWADLGEIMTDLNEDD